MIHAQTDIDLSSPSFTPKVLQSSEDKELGHLEFRINKPVNSDIPIHGFKLKIELSQIKPANGIHSLSGKGAELFTWEYDEDANVLMGTQTQKLTGFLYSGKIGLDFIVIANSTVKEPKNGFEASIFDVLDKYDIVKKNNILSNYTWTQSESRP